MAFDNFNYESFENDHEVYKNVWTALDMARSYECEYNGEKTIHMYWRVPREFGEKQSIALKSVITTQKNTRILLWSNVDLSENEYVKEVMPYIELRIYNPVAEAVGTSLEHYHGLMATDDLCWVDGDIFRLLVLHNYGGVYIDFDVIVLRDMNSMYAHEFMYQWGSSTWKSYDFGGINGAVMGLHKGSDLAKDLLVEASNTMVNVKSTQFGSMLYRKVRERNKQWFVFPCAFFNTEWQLAWDGNNFMKKCEQSTEMFDGAFAWHWHNKWDHVVEEGSKFHILATIVNDRFINKA